MSQLETDCNMATSLVSCWEDQSPEGNAGPCCATSAAEVALAANAPIDLIFGGQSPDHAAIVRRMGTVCPCPLWKRAMDIGGAIVGLVILSPLLLAVAVFIKCASRGPIFFRQSRFGAAGRPFTLWKFRTIEIDDAPERHRSHVNELMSSDRPLEKLDDELAVIKGGRIFRKLGVDELPQLFNVLSGDMSLVGPRPDVVPPGSYEAWQRRRFDVVPGITGLWQVSGKNRTTFSTMMRMDVAYVRRRSIWLDLIILLRTIPAIARD